MSQNPTTDRSIFLAAIDIAAPAQRDAFVAQACGENAQLRAAVQALLAAHGQSGDLLDAPDQVSPTIDQQPLERPGTQIGPYKLLQQIGEGGMGVVYMAEQAEPIARRVALKIIKPGMDTRQVIARFEAERQALAMMDHVNIARVLDAGTTEAGRPYFVMELVHGVPITKYCDDNRLTPRQRLELFVPVCQAIQHAHQKGIIHRDIKPSNVMVTLYDGKPVPKVIDFGVAKAIEQKLTERTLFTQYGTMVGTLEYMSPEQAEMSALGVDTRSDIYSLGVLLYELLTGSTPLSHKRMKEAVYAEILRMIKEDEPPKPSTRLSESGESLASISAQRQTEPDKLSKLMRGELDWIVMKTLEKDRNRRYETASGFAADVQRYLDDEPVQACPPSVLYRFRKLVRRNKVALVTAAVVAAALVMGTLASTWQAFRATRAERLAEERLEAETTAHAQANRERKAARTAQAEEAKQRAVAQMNAAEADAQRRRSEANLVKARRAVDQMLTRVGGERLNNIPIGGIDAVRKGLFEDALKFYEEFLKDNGDDPTLRLEAGKAWRWAGDIHDFYGEWAEAERAFRRSITLLTGSDAKALPDDAHRAALAESYKRLARLLVHRNRPESDDTIRRALELYEHLVAVHPDDPEFQAGIANCLSYEVGKFKQIGRLQDAEASQRKVIALLEKFPQTGSWGWERRWQGGSAQHGLGKILAQAGKPIDAERAYRQAIVTYQELVVENPTFEWFGHDLALWRCSLAELLHQVGRCPEAEEHFRAAIAGLQKMAADFPATPMHVKSEAIIQSRFAKLLLGTDRAPEAEQAYRRATKLVEGVTKRFPQAYEASALRFEIADYQHKLGIVLERLNKGPEAEQAYRHAIAEYSQAIEQKPKVPQYWFARGQTYQKLRHWDNAVVDFRKANELNPKMPEAHNNLAWLLATCPDAKFRDPLQAVAEAKKAVELAPQEGGHRNTLGAAHCGAGDWKAAIAALEKSMELCKGGDSFDWFFLAMAHWELGNKDEARQRYDQAVEWMNKNQPKNEELRRFRDEAAELLKIDKTPMTQPE